MIMALGSLKGMSPKEVDSIRAGASLESSIYDRLITLLSNKENQKRNRR